MIITAYATIETAVKAIKIGAFDYVEKPFSTDALRIKVNRALDYKKLQDDKARLEGQNEVLSGARDRDVAEERPPGQDGEFEGIIGVSGPMQRLFQMIAKLGQSDTNVHVSGESGTGNELVAMAIHQRSNRAEGPMIKVNCGAIPETLLESELFGHEKGAFTGAVKRKLGRFELAHGGTLFLDEVAEIPASMQVKLLRALQEKEIDRVGGERPVKIDVRVISATNRDLKKEVEEGRFREDLYYRLHVVPLHLPPLRERTDDIVPLARFFVEKLRQRTNPSITHLSKEAEQHLLSYHYPGNVRELENVIEQSLVFATPPAIDVEDLPVQVSGATPKAEGFRLPAGDIGLNEFLEAAERQMILGAYEAANGVKTETARRLKIKTSALYYKLEKYGIGTSYVPIHPLMNDEILALTPTTAVVQAFYEGSGAVFDVTAYWNTFDGGTNAAAWSNAVFIGSLTNVGLTNLTATLTGLETNTNYYFTFRMTNCVDDIWARPSGFFRSLSPPVVGNEGGATNLRVGTATLQGLLTNGGAADITIFWGRTDGGTNPAAWDASTSVGRFIEGRPFSNNVSGLLYGIPYFYRAWATNASGQDWADTAVRFKTRSPQALLVTNSMELWLKADAVGSNDTQNVDRWTDASGNGNDALQAGATLQPQFIELAINHQPAVRFDGNDRLRFNNINARTVFAVTRADPAAANLDGLIGRVCCDDGIRRIGNTGWRSGTGADGNDFTQPGGSVFRVNGTNFTGNATAPEDEWHIIEAFRGNGTQIHDAIGGYFANRDYNGDIAEIMVYNRVLNPTEIDEVGTYLEQKYDIGASYPGSGPAVAIRNENATGIGLSSAFLNGRLFADQSVLDVTLYFGPIDGGTNPAAWANSQPVGAFTNLAMTNLSIFVSNLIAATTNWFTFRATNCVEDIWAWPSV
ncbi:MAG: sigma 54-interacting transcriptional regulator, partial [Verrucomicrobiota bacterium]